MAGIRTINVAAAAAKFARRAGSAGEEYRTGIEGSQADWAGATTAAAASYKQGVAAAAAGGRFEKGVAKAGNAKWRANAAKLGPGRFSEGVANAQPAYAAGFGPYAAVIQGVNLPPRGPTGTDSNYNRSAVIGRALRAAKMAS